VQCWHSSACLLLIFRKTQKTHVSSDKAFNISYPENWKVNKDRRFEFSIYQGTGLLIPTMVNIEIRKKAEGYESADIHQISDAEMNMWKAQPATALLLWKKEMLLMIILPKERHLRSCIKTCAGEFWGVVLIIKRHKS